MYCPSKNTARVSLISFVALLAVALCLFAFAPAMTFAQSSNTGTVSGTVVDPSNAIVPGASVSLVNTATLAARSTLSNKEGQYAFTFVDPGNYSIKVSKTGFKTTVVANQQVRIGLQTTANVTLQVGATSTTVEVTSTPGAELQTLNPTVGTSFSGAIILNLPNTTRDASTLAALQPGQNINGNTGGLASDQNSFQLDGGYATDDMSGDNNTYIRGFGGDTAGGTGAYHSAGFNQTPSAVVPIPVASVQEFKISTSNQTADFNGGGGSQTQLITKRGTKTFHGGAYEYYLDNNFGGANTFDNNRKGIKQPGSHFSRFGADAGGEIPHVNFLGGNWFAFGLYEGFRFPQSSIFTRSFPLPSLRAGLIHLNGQTINLTNAPVVDPGCGSVTKKCKVTTTGQTINPTPGADPRGLGMNPVISSLWNTFLPLPNDCSAGDGLNYCGFSGPISTPQKSNFVVTRIDHDFGSKWHFNGTYHYDKVTNTVSDQWDIGGFFPGDKLGQYSAIRQKPQDPWLYTVGLTTDVSANLTNSFNFSYTRNWWAYGDPSGVPNSGFVGNLEIGGENSGAGTTNQPIFAPYNTNNQSTRTRVWNGHDWGYRDDLTWVRGNHLFQLGGSYQRNVDEHIRNDNGQSINTFTQYLIGIGFTAPLSGTNVDLSDAIPAGITSTRKYGSLFSMLTGMVDQSQSLFVRGTGSLESGLPLAPRSSCAIQGIAATANCVSSPPLLNTSIIPTYNLYFGDSWHVKPTFSLNYGLGWTVEMPPFETHGGVAAVMVDQNNHILSAPNYLNQEKNAALQGNPFAPLIGFDANRNVDGHSKYPYDPFYKGFSPRVGFAWNFRPDTVIRGGYARIFGRINGVDPVLVPMLTPGLMQPATCLGPQNSTNGTGGCSTSATEANAMTGFRIGTDGNVAPLAAPSPNLPQPWFPGFNDVATGSGETIDPFFRPNQSDEFTLSVQHQFGPKIIAEAGYIGRLLRNEVQYYSLTNVPYMMTEGGQTFANAWAQIMKATNYGCVSMDSTGTCSISAADENAVAPQPFFETALGGTTSTFCSGFPSCTAAFVAANDANGSFTMPISDPFDAWAVLSNGGSLFFNGVQQSVSGARTFTSDAIAASCPASSAGNGIGCGGQSPSIVTEFSNGYGNYNAGYLQLTVSNYHGLTMKTNLSYSNALGTGDVVQASSSFATNDPWNLKNAYGPQSYNERLVFNLFMNYESPFYASQQGVIGHLLGGWSISPLFVAGSGFPVPLGTANFDCGTFGECNTNFIGAQENGIITKNLGYNNTRKNHVTGALCGTFNPSGLNVFSNPDSVCPAGGGNGEVGIFGDPVRSPILGLDGQMGGGGPFTGLPFWNLDLGINKKLKINERFSGSLYFDFTNIANHMQPRDPELDIFSLETWGVLGGGGNVQANQPRQLQLGVSFDW